MNSNKLMINDELASWNIKTLHNAIKTSFKNYDINTLNFTFYSEEVMVLLFHLPSTDTFKFLKIIDKEIPGISFHFIMDCIHVNYSNNNFVLQKLLFAFRASYYLACFPEKEMLSPRRTTLCGDLLFSRMSKEFFLDFQQKMHDVDNRAFVGIQDKKTLKKDLYLKHFEKYIETITAYSH